MTVLLQHPQFPWNGPATVLAKIVTIYSNKLFLSAYGMYMYNACTNTNQ